MGESQSQPLLDREDPPIPTMGESQSHPLLDREDPTIPTKQKGELLLCFAVQRCWVCYSNEGPKRDVLLLGQANGLEVYRSPIYTGQVNSHINQGKWYWDEWGKTPHGNTRLYTIQQNESSSKGYYICDNNNNYFRARAGVIYMDHDCEISTIKIGQGYDELILLHEESVPTHLQPISIRFNRFCLRFWHNNIKLIFGLSDKNDLAENKICVPVCLALANMGILIFNIATVTSGKLQRILYDKEIELQYAIVTPICVLVLTVIFLAFYGVYNGDDFTHGDQQSSVSSWRTVNRRLALALLCSLSASTGLTLVNPEHPSKVIGIAVASAVSVVAAMCYTKIRQSNLEVVASNDH